MFQFPTFPSIHYFTYVWIHSLFLLCEFPHSDICGLMDICSSPQLFAAYHVLLRLLVPRHSPYALCSLTFWLRLNFALLCQASLKISSIYLCIISSIFVCFPRTARLYCAISFFGFIVFGWIVHTIWNLATSSNMLVYLLCFLYIIFNVLTLVKLRTGGDKGSRTLDLLLARQAL